MEIKEKAFITLYNTFALKETEAIFFLLKTTEVQTSNQ